MAQATEDKTKTPAITPPPIDQPVIEETVPATWPGAFGVYKNSKAAVMLNLWTIITIVALNIVLSTVIQSIGGKDNSLTLLLAQLVSAGFSMLLIYTYLSGVKKQIISVSEIFKKFDLTQFLYYLVNGVLLGLIGIFSFLLLVVPFFIIMPRLLLAPYFVLDKKLGPVQAIKASWSLTAGNVGKVWGIIGASLAMALLFLTIIGIPFAVYFLFMYGAATVVLYEYLNQHKPTPKGPIEA